jgi:hypothetical protein
MRRHEALYESGLISLVFVPASIMSPRQSTRSLNRELGPPWASERLGDQSRRQDRSAPPGEYAAACRGSARELDWRRRRPRPPRTGFCLGWATGINH